MSKSVTADRVIEALRGCYDPEIPVNIVDLGLVYDVSLNEGRARVRMTLTTPGCPAYDYLLAQVKSEVERIPGVNGAEVEIVWDPPWTPERMSEEARRRLESRSGGMVSLDFDPAVFRPVKKGHLVRNPNGTMVLINEANSRFLVNEDIARLWDKSHGGKTVYELAGLAAGELQLSPSEVKQHVVEIFRSLLTMGLLETGKLEK
jgi:FeS assembly SUF system protein